MSNLAPEMNWSHTPPAESFAAFKDRITLYLEDNDIIDAGKQATKIKIAVGDEGMRRLLASGLSEGDLKSPARLWEFFESQLDIASKINFRVHRLDFSQVRQGPEEATRMYVSRLREQAKHCQYEKAELNERMIEQLILSTPILEFRTELLKKDKGYSVTNAIELGSQFEAVRASSAQLMALNSDKSSLNVDAMKNWGESPRQATVKAPSSTGRIGGILIGLTPPPTFMPCLQRCIESPK